MLLNEYFNKVAPAIYTVGKDSKTNTYILNFKYYKWDIGDTLLIGKIYERANKIVNKFNESNKGTGAILHGLKGMGKSLLTKLVSNKLLSDGYPVIVIENEYFDSEFKTFVESLGDVCLLFDEFTRIYSKVGQDNLLTLLDGLSKGRRLTLMTTNDIDETIDPLDDRPSRIYYNIEFTGIDEVSGKIALDSRKISPVIRGYIELLIKIRRNINWDVLGALMDEAEKVKNLEEFKEVLDDMNVSADKLKLVQLTATKGIKIYGHKKYFSTRDWLRQVPLQYVSKHDTMLMSRRAYLTDNYARVSVGTDEFIDIIVDDVSVMDTYKDILNGDLDVNDVMIGPGRVKEKDIKIKKPKVKSVKTDLSETNHRVTRSSSDGRSANPIRFGDIKS